MSAPANVTHARYGTSSAAESLLFFRLHRPDWALFEVFFFWTSILALILFTFRVRRLSAALLVPYLAWVTFAGALNYADVQLNGPYP